MKHQTFPKWAKPAIRFFHYFCTDFNIFLTHPRDLDCFNHWLCAILKLDPNHFSPYEGETEVLTLSLPSIYPPGKLPCPPKIVGLEDYHLPFWNFVGEMVVFGGISLGVGCFCCVFFCCRAVIIYSNRIHFAKFNIDIFTKPPKRWAPSQSL